MDEFQQINVPIDGIEEPKDSVSSSRTKFIAIICGIAAIAVTGLLSVNTIRSEDSDGKVAEDEQISKTTSSSNSEFANNIPGISGIIDERLSVLESQDGGANTSIAISYQGQFASYQSTPGHLPNSASMAKIYWVAAALDSNSIDEIEPLAKPIFSWSDNDLSGSVIDKVSFKDETGIDAVNSWTLSLGLNNTYLANWSTGGISRIASDKTEGRYNSTSAEDMASFLTQLHSGNVFNDNAKTQAFINWMKLAPKNDPIASPTLNLLPQNLQVASGHKAGWLPDSKILNDAAIIPLNGSNLVVVFLTSGGSDYSGQSKWISETTCHIVNELASACTPPNEPEPVPDQTPEQRTTTTTTAKQTTSTAKQTTTTAKQTTTTAKQTTTTAKQTTTTQPPHSCEPNKYPGMAGRDFYFCKWLLSNNMVDQYLTASAEATIVYEQTGGFHPPLFVDIYAVYGRTIGFSCYSACGPLPYDQPAGW